MKPTQGDREDKIGLMLENLVWEMTKHDPPLMAHFQHYADPRLAALHALKQYITRQIGQDKMIT